MQTLIVTIKPSSPFGTLLKGDTFFGQFCWTLRDALGNDILEKCLEGYTNSKPFVVFSDAFPEGHLPRPTIPMMFFRQQLDSKTKEDRKTTRKRTWLPRENLVKPMRDWLESCVEKEYWEKHAQSHNSINRATGTTGDGFAPYSVEQYWPSKDLLLDIHIHFDTTRITAEQIVEIVSWMGQNGFGRDATIGLGKFTVERHETATYRVCGKPNAVLTLAPVAPKSLGFIAESSFYLLFNRFGRHGGQAQTIQVGNPFKNPILLADTGAIFTLPDTPVLAGFIGQGLGGSGCLSKVIPETIHQGYAPVIPVEFQVDQKKAG